VVEVEVPHYGEGCVSCWSFYSANFSLKMKVGVGMSNLLEVV
jgi:hypothetical protein